MVGDEPVLGAVGVARAPVLPDGEGEDERGLWRSLHGLEERGEERGELRARAVEDLDLPEVDRELVEEDERRLSAEELAEGVRSGRDPGLVALPHPLVAFLARERVCDLPPGREGEHTVSHGPAVHGIGVLAVEGGEADRAGGHQLRIEKLGDVGHAFEPLCRVRERNQSVGLAPAVRGVEPEDCSHLAACARESPADVREEVPEAPRRIGVGEEAGRIAVLAARLPGDDGREVGGKVGVRNRAAQDVLARHARVENGCDAHPSRLTSFLVGARILTVFAAALVDWRTQRFRSPAGARMAVRIEGAGASSRQSSP